MSLPKYITGRLKLGVRAIHMQQTNGGTGELATSLLPDCNRTLIHGVFADLSEPIDLPQRTGDRPRSQGSVEESTEPQNAQRVVLFCRTQAVIPQGAPA